MMPRHFQGNGRLSLEDEEIRPLKAENKRLQQDKDMLLKASVFFAA